MGVERIVSFTNWQSDHPSDRIPADRLDAQFDNHAQAIAELEQKIANLLRADGKLNHDLLTVESFPPDLHEDLIRGILTEAREERQIAEVVLREVESRKREVEAKLQEARSFAAQSSREFQQSLGLVGQIASIHQNLQSQVAPLAAEVKAAATSLTGNNNVATLSAAAAEDWAEVSMEWAEHMPDTIPPNILATNGVTGDHWSSRWWANQASQIVAGAINVVSFNTRSGAVVLTLGDVTGAGGAPIASPFFTGNPRAPTPTSGDDDTSIATTAFVQAALSGSVAGVASFNTRTGAVVLSPADVTAAGGALLASPIFTGDPHAPTPAPGDNDVSIATTAFVATSFAPIASPVFTGNPQAPTPAPGDADTSIATTAFVGAAIASAAGGFIVDAPVDGQQYGRQSAGWTVIAPNPTWTSLAGKPSTFPPTLPIAESDVTNLVADLALKAPLASPVFTGDPKAPTPSPGDNDVSIATTAFVASALAAISFAPLASPAFTGNPTAPTPAVNDNDTSIATTAFVQSAKGIGSVALGPSRVFVASGTFTPTAGMAFCIIECIGAGGGGGGTGNAGAGSRVGGGGGAGGSYSRIVLPAGTAGLSGAAVTVGAAGAGNAGNNNGAGGGQSSVGALCTAPGGGGGGGAAGAGGGGARGLGGGAGTGDFSVPGGDGQAGKYASILTVNMLEAGEGGIAGLGFGLGGRNAPAGGGTPGRNYGGGGAGGSSANSSGAGTGADGAPGVVIITEFVK